MNLRTTIAIATLLAMGGATPALAGLAPDTYRSTDLGGAVLLGRMSHSRLEGPTTKPGVGDVHHAASWDGEKLGTQWTFSCGVQSGPAMIKRGVDARGDGTVMTLHRFSGGRFFLAGAGPWGGRLGDVFGKLYGVTVQIDETFAGDKLVEAQVISEAWGIDELDRRVRFVTRKFMGRGDSGSERMPVTFPPLLDMACQPTRAEGWWYELGEITITIETRSANQLFGGAPGDEAPTGARAGSWGAIKAIYR